MGAGIFRRGAACAAPNFTNGFAVVRALLVVIAVKASTRVLAVAWIALGVVAVGCGGVTLHPSDGGSSAGHGGSNAGASGSAGGAGSVGGAGEGGASGTGPSCFALGDAASCKARNDCEPYLCPDCNGGQTFLACGVLGKGAPVECGPCPPSCTGLDQATCTATPGCSAQSCSTCIAGETRYAACYRSDVSPPPCIEAGCPAPVVCSGLDETSCVARSDCRAAYCPACGAGTGFAGCLTPTEALPQCPATTCPAPCDSFEETQCAKNGCTPLYCPTCSGGQVYEACNGPRDAAGCGSECVTSCTDLTVQGQCDARTDCHSVFVSNAVADCVVNGGCTFFTHCADGGKASCTGTAACQITAPYCDGTAFVVSYAASCYEGCVRPSECGP